MLCKDYGIHKYKRTLSKPGLGQGSGPGTQRPARFTRHTSGGQAAGWEYEYKLNNGIFSLLSLRLNNFNVTRIEKAVTVYGFRGSGFNKNLKSPTSKLNKRNVTLNGEP